MTGVVVDSSAILAILLQESDGPTIAETMNDAGERLISAATLVEASMVMEARADVLSSAGYPTLCVGDDFAQTGLEVVPAR